MIGTVLGAGIALVIASWVHDPHAIIAFVFAFVTLGMAVLPLNYGAFAVFLTPGFVLLVNQRGDAGMPHPLQRGDLAAQAVARDRVRADVRVQQLERDDRTAAVDRAVDRPHAARSQGRQDAVAAHLRARCGAAVVHGCTLAVASDVCPRQRSSNWKSLASRL